MGSVEDLQKEDLQKEDLLMLEKLFQYITSYIINNEVFEHFHQSLVHFDRIDDKREIDFDHLDTLEIKKRMDDAIEFMEVFLKNSKLDVSFAEFSRKICDVGSKTFNKILDDCSDGMVVHVLESYRVIVSTYFSHQRALYPVYISIFYEYMKLTDKAGDTSGELHEHRMKHAIIQGAGPVFIKTIQQFAHIEKQDATINELLNDVYDNLAPVCDSELELIRRHLDVSSLEDCPISVASIGQVHCGVLDGEDVVVKFIKPRSLLYIFCEIHALVGDSRATDNVCDADRAVDEKVTEYIGYKIYKIGKEFSFDTERENSERINRIYSSANVSSVKIMSSKDIPVPCLTMTRGRGVSLRQFLLGANSGANLTASAVPAFKELIRLWMTNTLLYDGFSHADLHPGNILIDTESEPYKITLIDFGSVACLNRSQQYTILKLIDIHASILKNIKGGNGKGVEALYERSIMTFCDFCEVTLDKTGMETLIGHVAAFYMNKIHDTNANVLFGDLIKEMMFRMKDIGKCTSSDLVDFGKGFFFIENTWLSLGDSKDMIETYIDAIKYYPHIVAQLLYKKLMFMIYN
jgi:hypothetical protein